MQFNSYEFIFIFLPLVVLLYFLMNVVKPKFGKIVLIVASLIFYSYGRPNMLLFLIASLLINYPFSIIMSKQWANKKTCFFIPLFANIALLLYFKYCNFAIISVNSIFKTDFRIIDILLPIRISFFSFQQIAYLVARYHGELENTSIIDYLVYILYFPKLIMGPLEDPVDFISKINSPEINSINYSNLATGIKIFGFGLFKKALLADSFSRAVSWTYANIESATAIDCLLLIIFYSFEIYFDFSGYCDMAVGVSSLFNIELMMNFDSPYKAISIRDFWKRWHISLTKFFTKYVYIPLGGSKKGKTIMYINILVVFLISGLWHGGNWTFILWGMFHGVLCCLDRISEKWQSKIPIFVRWICTFCSTGVLWLLFSSSSVGQWKSILVKIFRMKNTTISEGLINSFKPLSFRFLQVLFKNGIFESKQLCILLFVLMSFVICLIPRNNYIERGKLSVASLLLSSSAFICGLLCLSSESTFIYNWF